MCRLRVAERQWNDVARLAPPPADKRKTALELDDKKSGKVDISALYIPLLLASLPSSSCSFPLWPALRLEKDPVFSI